jgi:hypothetical protein
LVTLALGLMPTLTAELELELEPVLDVLEDELALLLLDEPALDLPPPDLPPALDVELDDEAAKLKLTLEPEPCTAMLASIGARPSAIVISQRVRLIRSLRAIGLRKNPSARRASLTERKNPRLPASQTQWRGSNFPLHER